MLEDFPYNGFHGRDMKREIASAGPEELLERLEAASMGAVALWKYVVLIPNTRPELRALLCHIWDGCTSDSMLSRKMGVHRHTVKRWRKELCELLNCVHLHHKSSFSS